MGMALCYPGCCSLPSNLASWPLSTGQDQGASPTLSGCLLPIMGQDENIASSPTHTLRLQAHKALSSTGSHLILTATWEQILITLAAQLQEPPQR